MFEEKLDDYIKNLDDMVVRREDNPADAVSHDFSKSHAKFEHTLCLDEKVDPFEMPEAASFNEIKDRSKAEPTQEQKEAKKQKIKEDIEK